ncbi:MAG: 3-isopropylmalate dehydrogenase [Rhodospirillales bacterium 12-71-4]|nr:MAG: 3-isopropylmalate dehydrogenase [Rhodospirillales bacterium 12-71-4]
MPANKKLLILPGDGIGPEVMREVRRIIDWMDRRRSVTFEIEEGLVGGAALDATGSPCPDETVAAARRADAVLFGSVGGPRWDSLPFDRRPELGILRLRKDLQLFANLRPAVVLDALIDASALRPDLVRGLDIMIVRETTGGIYFGEPRGIHLNEQGRRVGVDTEIYSEDEIARVARVAFDLARKRRNKVTSVEKANVMQSGRLWRAVVGEIGKAEYPDVELEHMYADNCAMQLASRPKQFDVVLGGNLFGDVLSDLAAADGRRTALYEPIHGSAPDIAGKGVANPSAQILSFAMLLRLSFGMDEDAALIEQAVEKVLGGGLRTADIMAPGMARVGTSVMGEAVLRELEKLSS